MSLEFLEGLTLEKTCPNSQLVGDGVGLEVKSASKALHSDTDTASLQVELFHSNFDEVPQELNSCLCINQPMVKGALVYIYVYISFP